MGNFALGFLHVFTPVALAIVINSIIFTNDWNNNNDDMNNEVERYLPPGWVVGTVWILILGCLGYGLWLVRSTLALYIMFIFMIGFCLLYPFFTIGLQQGIGKYMNVMTFFLALVLLFMALGFDRRVNVILTLIPLVAWVTYVNIAQLLTLRL
jgi:tryptophan-rich sensory protein